MQCQPNPTLPDRCDLVLSPLFRVRGVRNTPLRSKGSQIGKIVCPTTNVVIPTEGTTEHNATVCLYADRNIAIVRSQPVRIPYFDADGVERTHVLDLRATRIDGYRYGLLGKTADEAERKDLPGFTEWLAMQVGREVADELRPITNEDMPEYQVRNARMFRKVRLERRTWVDDDLRTIAPGLLEPVMIRELTAMLGGGRLAFRPVVRAIFYGTLEPLSDGFIDPFTLVKFSGKVMPDLDAGRRTDPSLALELYEPPVRKPKRKS